MLRDNSVCRYCHRDIIWVKTPKGHNMPLDPEALTMTPGESGADKLVTLDGKVITGRLDPCGETVAYRAHWATCPYANKARKGDPRRAKA